MSKQTRNTSFKDILGRKRKLAQRTNLFLYLSAEYKKSCTEENNRKMREAQTMLKKTFVRFEIFIEKYRHDKRKVFFKGKMFLRAKTAARSEAV